MENKLDELTRKIYLDGVEKGKQEAQNIIENAKKEAEQIIEKAKQEAKNIINNATNEATQIKNKVLQELKMSSNQAISTLKQEITEILCNSTLNSTINKSFNDLEFIKTIIKEIISKWDISKKSLDLNIILPEKSKQEFTNYFKTKANDILSKGIEISFESRMENGFKIVPKDKSYVLSFTDNDFIQFFKSFLKQKTKEILFSGEK